MGIGKQIKKARKAKGLTQLQLAQSLGISKSAVANYESNFSHPKEEILIKMFRVLEVDPNQLFQDAFLVDEFGDLELDHPTSVVMDTPSDSYELNLAAHRPDGYDKDLPEEALKELDSFLDYLRVKYKKD